MCGRFTLFADDADLVTLFDINVLEGEHRPAFNQAPSQMIRAVIEEQERTLGLTTWGLKPSWAKPGFRPLINARSETLTEKPSFRTAARRRRCLIPTNGYYEWSEGQPYFMSLPGEPVLAMAGIYEDNAQERTAAVVTRAAPEGLAHIHDRTPLFVPRPMWAEWLARDISDPDEVQALIAEAPYPPLEARKVSRAVGNVAVTNPQDIFVDEGWPTTLL